MKRISLTGWFVTFLVAAFLLWAIFVLTSDLTYVPDVQDETVERCDTPITNAAGDDYERRVTTTITLTDKFSEDYSASNSFVWTRPKYGRWRKCVSGDHNDTWASATDGLTELSPREGIIIKRLDEKKEKSIVITRPYSRE